MSRGAAVRQAAGTGSDDWFTVATFNVLGNSHTTAHGKNAGMASGPARIRGVVQILDKYAVDVVGLQELQRPQAEALTRLVGSTYALWWPPGETPENAMAYRRDRWSLAGTSSVAIPYFNGHIRRMPVVRLEDRATGRQVAFVNVHNPADTRQFSHQGRWRTEAVTREIGLVRELSTRFPVVMTGDLNDRHDAFCRLSAGGGLISSNGGSTAPCRPARGSGIDWILGSPAVVFSRHIVDHGPLVRVTSDHPVVLARALVEP